MGREFDKLVTLGENIGTWDGKANFYDSAILYDQAEKVRVLAFQR